MNDKETTHTHTHTHKRRSIDERPREIRIYWTEQRPKKETSGVSIGNL